MDTTTFIDPTVVGWVNKNVVFAKINGRPGEQKHVTQFAQDWGVKGFPTYVLVGADGREIDRDVDYMDSELFLKTFTDFLAGRNTLDDYLTRNRENPSSELLFKIAYKYQWRGASDQAETFYQEVIDADPERADTLTRDAYFLLADMARRDMEYDVAVERYERFRALYPDHELAQWSLIYAGICFRDKGDTAAAIRTFERFIEEYPDSEDTDYCQRQIATLKEEREEN